MTKANTKKVIHAVVIVVAVAAAGVLVQWGRWASKAKDFANGTTAVFPKNYFPFNGVWSKENDKLTKVTA